MDGLEREDISDEVVEKDRPNSGHADRGGVAEIEGDGDESLV